MYQELQYFDFASQNQKYQESYNFTKKYFAIEAGPCTLLYKNKVLKEGEKIFCLYF